MDGPWIVSGVFLVLVGLVMGSFWNVAIVRLPADRSLWPRSHCDTCGATIRPYDLVPVASYFVLRGRCRDCGAAIPATVPLIEALGGLVGFLLFRRFIDEGQHVDLPHLAAAGLYLLFVTDLVVVAMVDLRHHIIPDETSIYSVPIGIAGVALLQWLGYHGWPYLSWQWAVIGAALWGTVFAAFALAIEFVFRREGLGWGDVKLVAMIGAFLGAFPGAMITLFIGTLLGSVTALVHLAITRRRSYLPLGPFIALGAALYLFYGDVVVELLFPGLTLMSREYLG
jgi:leader peptidase (prepilin peptidase)/N-methyltransferase